MTKQPSESTAQELTLSGAAETRQPAIETPIVATSVSMDRPLHDKTDGVIAGHARQSL